MQILSVTKGKIDPVVPAPKLPCPNDPSHPPPIRRWAIPREETGDAVGLKIEAIMFGFLLRWRRSLWSLSTKSHGKGKISSSQKNRMEKEKTEKKKTEIFHLT